MTRFPTVLLMLAVLGGCATAPTGPGSPSETSIPAQLDLARLQEQSQGGVTVRLSIPTDEEVSRKFGVPFAEHGIQPIWIHIDNQSDTDYWLLPIAIDPDYYSADEAALLVGARMPDAAAATATETLRANALPFFFAAGKAQDGYVYATHMRGGRYVDVRLTGRRRSARLRFAVLLPTEAFDYEKSPLRELYARVESFPSLSVDELRQRLRELPCCTTNADGSAEGDPLNIVLVGTGRTVLSALSASGWMFTEAITVDSVRRMIGAAIAEKAMLTAPVSSLYALGRKQEFALQRGRTNINQRNHMRLWLAPFRCEGKPVWIGQVSRDIGVKLTSKSPTLTTHVIDPVVDESREYLLHGLLFQEAVERFAFVQGVGEATREAPRRNLTGDPYFTDGNRMVVWLSDHPVPSDQADNLWWNPSTDPVLEGKGDYAVVPGPEP